MVTIEIVNGVKCFVKKSWTKKTLAIKIVNGTKYVYYQK